MVDRPGPLLLGIRTERDASGERVFDVFIGRIGKSTFPEYPTNLVVIRGRPEAEVRDLLDLPAAFSFATDVEYLSDTDLISHL